MRGKHFGFVERLRSHSAWEDRYLGRSSPVGVVELAALLPIRLTLRR